MKKKGKEKGRGIHSTPKELDKNISKIESLPYVSRVIIGQATGKQHAYSVGFMKHTRDMVCGSGIRVNGYTNKGIMNLFIYTGDIEKTKKFIEDLYKTKRQKKWDQKKKK